MTSMSFALSPVALASSRLQLSHQSRTSNYPPCSLKLQSSAYFSQGSPSFFLKTERSLGATQINVSSHGRRSIETTSMAGQERSPPTADASPLVKLAWYGSEAFGKAVAVFRGKGGAGEEEELAADAEFGAVIERDVAMEALRKDYERSYFVTGAMSMGLYAVDCEFADPFVSFKGRRRFKQNVSNLGSFMEEVNLKVLDWKVEEDQVTTKWRFSCVLGLPWRPILAASGGTTHYFDTESGKIYKHVERWDISPADGVRQLFKPNPRQRGAK
eukprot:TRINITY_DN2377_c0_g2_i1.p1 TRINITY_DN2377_c0_g2~~TRINITY_DN2377_c0_g2_i1.p1  ORF type:complete len:272 (-),score=39.06 TRINITY_DN2377_c0_g2_i1:586-1401(-)